MFLTMSGFRLERLCGLRQCFPSHNWRRLGYSLETLVLSSQFPKELQASDTAPENLDLDVSK